MFTTSSFNVFNAFGLRINSEINLPELFKCNRVEETIDVTINLQDLTDAWNSKVEDENNYVIYENKIMFKIPNTAIFQIEDGKKISVSPNQGASEANIRLYLLGSCMGVILLQRGILPLHGSAIEIEGLAYAIVGNSGVGKSTLATTFLHEGYNFLSDGVVAIEISNGNTPHVLPSYPQQKLWQQSLDVFGMDSRDYSPIYDRETKFSVPVRSNFCSKPLPLGGIFELVKSNGDKVELRTITGIECIQLLFRNTYRSFTLKQLNLMEWHFRTVTSFLDIINVYQLKRPLDFYTASNLKQIIVSTITKVNQKYVEKNGSIITDTVHRVEGNVVSDMNGEKVMLSIKNGKYYNLGVSGGDIWDELEFPLEVERLVEKLLTRYEIERDECERHVISFLNQLLDEELIDVH